MMATDRSGVIVSVFVSVFVCVCLCEVGRRWNSHSQTASNQLNCFAGLDSWPCGLRLWRGEWPIE